jgi:D-glycero-D-manno-heptose 1,7-bisphosphate phosphatase
MQKAVFIDKDGTLIRNIPYNADPELITFETGAEESLHLLHEAGYKLILITNQSGIAHGYFSEKEFHYMMEKLQERLSCKLDAWFYCPHHPEGSVPAYAHDCMCRKPKPGLLLKAAKKLDIDMKLAWMIGDILHDMEAGNLAGCRTILINNGGETEWKFSALRLPTVIATDLPEAARYIIANEHQNKKHVSLTHI